MSDEYSRRRSDLAAIFKQPAIPVAALLLLLSPVLKFVEGSTGAEMSEADQLELKGSRRRRKSGIMTGEAEHGQLRGRR